MSSDLHERARALADRLTELVLRGRLQEAVPVSRESVEAHRILADGRDEYLLDFAIALQGLSAVLQWTDRLDEAVPSLREELGIRRRLAEGSDTGHRGELARVLSILGTALASVGEFEEAALSGAESVRICRRLFALDRTAHRQSLGHSLTDLLRVHVGWERFEDANSVAREAVQIWRGSDEDLIHLAEVLHMRAFALTRLGSDETAFELLGESLEIYERLGEQSRPQFAGGLAAYGRLLGVAGRTQEATRFLIEALALANQYGHQDPAEAATGLLQDAYRVDPQAMSREWKRATGTEVPGWVRG
jgi:tetratricopeptide (TPR) repeat protein